MNLILSDFLFYLIFNITLEKQFLKWIHGSSWWKNKTKNKTKPKKVWCRLFSPVVVSNMWVNTLCPCSRERSGLCSIAHFPQLTLCYKDPQFTIADINRHHCVSISAGGLSSTSLSLLQYSESVLDKIIPISVWTEFVHCQNETAIHWVEHTTYAWLNELSLIL